MAAVTHSHVIRKNLTTNNSKYEQIKNFIDTRNMARKNETEFCYGAVQRIFLNPKLLWKWVGGSRSHSEFFCGKSSQNSSKPVLIFWSSIPYVFCLYIN